VNAIHGRKGKPVPKEPRPDFVNTPPNGIDLSKAPLGERAARALVEGLRQTDDRAERHYLEAKGHVDLATKVGHAKVAKFILGAANRLPETAQRYFEGYAVMALGVTAGAAPGVQPIEMLELERGVGPYLGTNRPDWDIQRVPVGAADREVLLILVNPPKWGEHPFVCRKTFQPHDKTDSKAAGLTDGTIYVRADGETRPATSAEYDALVHRGDRADIDLLVAIDGSAWYGQAHEPVLDKYLTAERRRLLAALPSQIRDVLGVDLATRMAVISRLGVEIEEDRTKDEYRESIDAWTSDVREWWNNNAHQFAALICPTFTIKVINKVNTFLEDVVAKVYLAGDVEAMTNDDWKMRDSFPTVPRQWGPRKPDWLDPAQVHLASAFPPAGLPSVEPISFDNTGSVTLTVDIGDLRPRSTVERQATFVLIAQSVDSSMLDGTWEITARGHHQVFDGSLSVPVETRDDVSTAARRWLSQLRTSQ
jgi:hypothetical protein